MKLNLSTAVIVKPARMLEASNKLCVTHRGLTVSSSLMSKMGYPKAIKLYVDHKNKQLFIVPCKPDSAGARAVKRPGTLSIQGKPLSSLLSKIMGIELDNHKVYFDAEEVDDQKNALGFDLTKGTKKEYDK